MAQLYMQLHTKIVHDQFASACRDVSVASGATGKEDAQKTWKAGDTVSVLSYAVRKPVPETYISNFHYDGFKGPTHADPSIIPTLFKGPHDFYSQPAKKPCRFLDRFRTVLMILNHLHRVQLSLHSSNWKRSTWNTRMRLTGLKRMYNT